MSQSREHEIITQLRGEMGTLAVKLFTELLQERIESHKERLVSEIDPLTQGRAQECRDLLKWLSRDFA